MDLQHSEVREAEEPCEGAAFTWDEPHQEVCDHRCHHTMHNMAAEGVVHQHESYNSAE